MIDAGDVLPRRPARTVAIDGPAGAGKSTLARAAAAQLRLHHLDTGAMYRAVTYAVLHDDVDLGDPDAVGRCAETVTITIERERVRLDDHDITTAIRDRDVTALVSEVSAHPRVRRELVRRQRAWVAAHGGGVVEGRDIGTVVLPDADLKVYVTASPRTRAARRVAEAGGDLDEVETAIDLRDRHDAERADSPLRAAQDAVVVDTTNLSVGEAVDRIVRLATTPPRPPEPTLF